MKNINFSNPYILLALIPLLAAIIIPYVIAIKKDNRTKEATIALISHIIIAVLAVLAAAGLKSETIMTETELYVVADVSYSTNEKTELIDSYIKELERQLPDNSKMGIIVFGKDVKLLTKAGEELKSVKDSGVDYSATDIAAALRFAKDQFSGDSLKRLVLYTDGMSTDPGANGDIANAVDDLVESNVQVDVVYIDSNLDENSKEMQISDVSFDPSTYIGKDTKATVLVESVQDGKAVLALTRDGQPYLQQEVDVVSGVNLFEFKLYTDVSSAKDSDDGQSQENFGFNYDVSIIYSNSDTSEHNNSYQFTQIVRSRVSILHLTDEAVDSEYIAELYGDIADVTTIYNPQQTPVPAGDIPEPFYVPYSVEELCQYDEIILSNIDISGVQNASKFMESLDVVISRFGKSLITAGNVYIQNASDSDDAVRAEILTTLGNMLPVNMGNNAHDPKLYTIVIDASGSMEFENFQYFKMAKEAAHKLIDILNNGDRVAVYAFAGTTYAVYDPVVITKDNRDIIKDAISELMVKQGTMLGSALNNALNEIKDIQSSDKQMMIISDGMAYAGGTSVADDAILAAEMIKANDITLSAIHIGQNKTGDGYKLLEQLATIGGGKFYSAKSIDELEDVTYGQLADDVKEFEVIKDTPVIVADGDDETVYGLDLPNISGYYYSKSKPGAHNVLEIEHKKKGSSIAINIPLYSYWDYGEGRIATLATDIGGRFVQSWSSGDGLDFLHNISESNTPDVCIRAPYTVEAYLDGKQLHISIMFAEPNFDSNMKVTVTFPDGTVEERTVSVNSDYATLEFETEQIGKYLINTNYMWLDGYDEDTIIDTSYLPEYNSFAAYTSVSLHQFTGNKGTITEEGNAELVFEKEKFEIKVVKFELPLLIIAALMYLADTILRKLKWADLKSFCRKLVGKGIKK